MRTARAPVHFEPVLGDWEGTTSEGLEMGFYLLRDAATESVAVSEASIRLQLRASTSRIARTSRLALSAPWHSWPVNSVKPVCGFE
jgi:hypothetical protein